MSGGSVRRSGRRAAACPAGGQPARRSGVEQPPDLRRHVRDPGLVRFGEHGSRTCLQTRGKRGQMRRVEVAGLERTVHVVLEAPHRHRAGAREPGLVEALRPGREHERHKRLRLRPGDAARAPGRRERRQRENYPSLSPPGRARGRLLTRRPARARFSSLTSTTIIST
jgi:hypothetical protein